MSIHTTLVLSPTEGPLSLPFELWEQHIIPCMISKDICSLICTHPVFNKINWRHMLNTEHPVLYKHLFKEISNTYTIKKIKIDYMKIYLSLHGNSRVLKRLRIFIKGYDASKSRILALLHDYVSLCEILIQHFNSDDHALLEPLLDKIFSEIGTHGNTSNNLLKILFNDNRLEKVFVRVLSYFSLHNNFDLDMINLIMSHPNFAITNVEAYRLIFRLCIHNNMKSIKILNDKLPVTLNLDKMNTVVDIASAIKCHIEGFNHDMDFRVDINLYMAKAISAKNKDMVMWMLANASNIHRICRNLCPFLVANNNIEYIELLHAYDTHSYPKNVLLLSLDDIMYEAIKTKNVYVFKHFLQKMENAANGHYGGIRSKLRATLNDNYSLPIIKAFLDSKSLNVKKSISIQSLVGKDQYSKTIKYIKLCLYDSIYHGRFEVFKLLIEKYDLKILDDHLYLLACGQREDSQKDLLKYMLMKKKIPFIENAKYSIRVTTEHKGTYDCVDFTFLKDGDFSFMTYRQIDM